MAFAGFPPSTLKLIRGLSKNNDKAWFEKNRALYQEGYVDAACAFIDAIGPKLEKVVPEIEAQPKINGSLFRINRDIRFSKDKTPYKDHVDMRFWEGDRKSSVSGFFMRIAPKEVLVGVGSHGFDKNALKAFRYAVADPQAGAELAKLAKKLTKAGYEIEGESYKRTPKGYDEDGPGAAFLRHGALHAMVSLPVKIVSTKSIVTEPMKHFKKLAPLHTWLIDNVQNA